MCPFILKAIPNGFLDKYSIILDLTMKIYELKESTTSGSVASVAQPLGATQTRTKSIFKGKKTKKKFYEAPEFTTKQQVIDYFVSRGKTAQQGASAWERGYRGSKKPKTTAPEHWLDRFEREQQDREDQKSVTEQELQEQDVIIVPGMRRMKDKSFIPHKADRRDHEVEMARSEVYAAAKDAMRIFKLLKDRSEDEGLMGWQQSYITLAADYLNSVADNIEYNAQMKEDLDKMAGGVLAGGMSNFEEGVAEGNYGISDIPRFVSFYNKKGQLVGTSDHNGFHFTDEYYQRLRQYFERAQIDQMASDYSVAQKLKSGSWTAKKEGVAGGLSEMDNSTPSGDRREQRANRPEEKVRREKEQQERLKNVSPEMRKKIGLPEPKEQGVTEGGYYNPLDQERKEQDAMDQERRDFKRREMEYELRNEPKNNYQVNIDGKRWKVFASKEQAEKAARTIERKYNKKATVHLTGAAPTNEAKAHKCPKCGGEMVSEELMNEKKDACYYKVKSRYKVWPSAYASGALVKCRKVGASNWGKNKK